MAIPLGDLSDAVSMGVGAEGYGIFTIPPQMGILPGLGFWYLWGEKSYGWVECNYSFMRICPFGDFRVSFGAGPAIGFIQGGLGIYIDKMTASVDGSSSSDSENRLGVRFGGGVKVTQAEFIGMVVITGDDTDMVTLRVSFVP